MAESVPFMAAVVQFADAIRACSPSVDCVEARACLEAQMPCILASVPFTEAALTCWRPAAPARDARRQHLPPLRQRPGIGVQGASGSGPRRAAAVADRTYRVRPLPYMLLRPAVGPAERVAAGA
eukprot:3221149-Rhodomonas_salina.4